MRIGDTFPAVRRDSRVAVLFFAGGEFLSVEEPLLEVVGDLALFADSTNQCLMVAS